MATKPDNATGVISNALSAGLVFYGPFNSDNVDLVSSDPGIGLPGGVQGTGPEGLWWESNSESNGGIYWPYNLDLDTGLEGGTEYTVLFYGELDSAPAYGVIVEIPDDATTWAPPYHRLVLQKNQTTTNLVTQFADTSDTLQSPTNPTNAYLSYDGSTHLYGVSRNGNAIKYYLDGNAPDTGDIISTNGQGLGTTPQVYLFSRNQSAGGEGTNGRVYVAAIWNRALSDAEVASFYADPYQLAETPAAGITRDNTTITDEQISGAGQVHVIGAGDNRQLNVYTIQESSSDVTSVTYGDQSLTFLQEIQHPDLTSGRISKWQLKEVGIAAAVGNEVVVNGATAAKVIESFFNVDQTLADFDQDDAASTASITTPSMVGVVDGLMTAVGFSNTDKTFQAVANQTLVGQDPGITGFSFGLYEKEVAGNDTVTATIDSNTTRMLISGISMAPVGGGSTAPNITDITPASPEPGETGVVITGTNFGAVQGAGTVTYGSFTLAVTAWSDTSITVTWPIVNAEGNAEGFNRDYDLTVTVV